MMGDFLNCFFHRVFAWKKKEYKWTCAHQCLSARIGQSRVWSGSWGREMTGTGLTAQDPVLGA